jgi:hypothetical protein
MERFPEPLLLAGGAFVWFLYGASAGGCIVLRFLRRQFPSWGIVSRFIALFITFAVLDATVQFFFIVPQLWAYPGAPQGWFTLFSGTRFQFPLWEPIVTGVWACGMTAIRYFRDDRGRSFAERGIDDLRISTRRKKVVSTLALTGIMHTWIWVGFMFPYAWLIGLKADTMPEVPSYYRSGICGAGTQYACPSEFVPIPGRDSIPIGPDDPRLPQSVRDRQGFPTPSR